jgi:hypothetical protein
MEITIIMDSENNKITTLDFALWLQPGDKVQLTNPNRDATVARSELAIEDDSHGFIRITLAPEPGTKNPATTSGTQVADARA